MTWNWFLYSNFIISARRILGFAGVLSADLGWVPDKNEAGFVAGGVLIPTGLRIGVRERRMFPALN